MTTRWTKAMDSLLGTKADIAIAEQLDLCLNTVLRRRTFLKIPPHRKYSKPRSFKPIPISKLGTVPDSVLAQELGVSQQRIHQYRKRYNIPSFRDKQK